MSLDTVGYVLGLVGLAIALFPKSVEEKGVFFWVGLVFVGIGCLAVARSEGIEKEDEIWVAHRREGLRLR